MDQLNQTKSNKRTFGSFGEQMALNFLIKNNYRIIEQNYRVGKLGEVDIIASDGDYTCFVEVKTRSSKLYGMPSEAVNKRKQENIKKLSCIYMSHHGLINRDVRFDVIEIIVKNTGTNGKEFEVQEINLIKNAF